MPSDDAASPATRRALAYHSPQRPSHLTSFCYKELIMFHASSRLTKPSLMMSTESDSSVPCPRYCFYFAMWVKKYFLERSPLHLMLFNLFLALTVTRSEKSSSKNSSPWLQLVSLHLQPPFLAPPPWATEQIYIYYIPMEKNKSVEACVAETVNQTSAVSFETWIQVDKVKLFLC